MFILKLEYFLINVGGDGRKNLEYYFSNFFIVSL